MFYNKILRPLLFAYHADDPEYIHDALLGALGLVGRSPAAVALLRWCCSVRDRRLERHVFGLTFKNPVGLAAGFDKNARALSALSALGFGFIEVGTVTHLAQPGNPRPRLFRLPKDQAIINRMGFNNDGASALAERLKNMPPLGGPLGISLGKSKITPLDGAVEDYLASFRILYPYGDYFAVNVSSPNTPGLRQLQERSHLQQLLSSLVKAGQEMTAPTAKPKPILVKIAPDLTQEAIIEVLEVVTSTGVSGIIAANTTLGRDGLARPTSEVGGLSGRPLTAKSLALVRFIHDSLPEMPIIGVGGIFSRDDAERMFDAGASLIQIFTGFIYQGPLLPRSINRGLLK